MRDTRYLIAEQAQRILNGGATTTDTEVRLEELVIFVDQAYAAYIKNAYWENRNDGENYVNGNFVFYFSEDVKFDSKKNRYYISIPSSFVSLPNGMGIYSVTPNGDDDDFFVPINLQVQAMSSGLNISFVNKRKSYYVQGNNLYICNIAPDFSLTKLNVGLVGGIQGDQDIDYNLSMDIQQQLVSMVVEMYSLQAQAPKDEVSDNVKNS